MSRSYLHHNIIPFAGCRSEKYDKKLTNKGMRRISKRILDIYDPEELMESHFPTKDDIMDHWEFGKDGHCVLATGKQIFISENFLRHNNNKYYGHYVTKEGHIRK